MRNTGFLVIGGILLSLYLSGCGLVDLKPNSKVKETSTENRQQLGCITLYEHIHFQGKTKKICTSNANISNDFNDIASSLKADCSIKSFSLYEHINYKGRVLSLKGCSQISDINQIDETFNDIVSSIMIKNIDHVE